MAFLTAASDRDLVVRRLQERRAAGHLSRGDVSRAASVCGVSTSTIYRWLGKGHAQRVKRHQYQLTEADKMAYFEATGDAALAYRRLLHSDSPPPSLATYRRAIDREWDLGTRIAARHGAAERQQYRVALRGGPYARNERWEADHTQLEVEVLTPRGRKPVRPWLTWLIDAGTRYIGGWSISVNPNRGHVLAVLRLAVEHTPDREPFHGVPNVIVWDNGLEFTANAVTEAAVMLGSYAAPTLAYSPERKPRIERANQTIERELLATLPYYTKGPRAKDGRLYGPPGGRLTLEMLVALITAWIDHYNFERPHSGLAGKTPLEAWRADPTPVRKVSRDDLRRFTLERRRVTVSHDGGINVDRRTFSAPELHELTRRKVEVGLLPHDYSLLEVFVDDRWVCTAKPVESLSAADVAAHRSAARKVNAEAGRLQRKRTRSLRERFAPITKDDPEVRVLPPDPSIVRATAEDEDVLGFGGVIGSVRRR